MLWMTSGADCPNRLPLPKRYRFDYRYYADSIHTYQTVPYIYVSPTKSNSFHILISSLVILLLRLYIHEYMQVYTYMKRV